MAFSIADKFEYDLAAVATAKMLPLTVMKRLVMKLFNMAPFATIPDKIFFVEESKAFTPVVNDKGETLDTVRTQRLLLNGEDSVIIGLRPGEGTDAASVTTYIFKAQPGVYDLSVWLPAA
jgi:hypothetical protein